MHALLQRRLIFFRLAQLLVLLYGLTLGVAIISPVINPKILNLVCTSTGYKFIAQDASAERVGSDSSPDTAMQGHLLDCSLCLPSGVLLTTYDGIAYRSSNLYAYLLPHISEPEFRSVITAALPARGPPTDILV